MESSSLNTAVPIHCIGEEARSILIPGIDGRVLAAFSSAIYLLNTQNDLCWLSIENAPMHRRAIQVGGALPRVVVDTPFAVADQHLRFGPDIVLDFSQARGWKSAYQHPTRVLRVYDLTEHLFAFISLLDHLPPAEGFGILIPNILKFIREQPLSRPNSPLDGPAKFAWPTIQDIAKACLARDFMRMVELAEELVGLGEGLTPSGDDFIGGLLFCFVSLRQTYDFIQDIGFPNLDPFLQRSKSRTNLISFTMLKDHASGHASEALHNFMNAQLTGQLFEFVRLSAMELVQIGHSTGWDLLAGVLTGLLVTVGVSTANTPQVRASPSYVTS